MYNGDCKVPPPPPPDTEGVQNSPSLVRSVPLLLSITTSFSVLMLKIYLADPHFFKCIPVSHFIIFFLVYLSFNLVILTQNIYSINMDELN